MIIPNRWKEPIGRKLYVATDKEPVSDFGDKGLAYWTLARRIEDKFGNEPAAVKDIYHEVTGPLGLNSSDTIALVRAATKEGYLK